MLEALVSSRVRRTLFEYLLTHPHDRFYLRGLAKELGLSISPLRRELKRQEQSGMLRTCQEANALFYTLNTDSPAFLQIKQASGQPAAEPGTQPIGATAPSPTPTAVAEPISPPRTNEQTRELTSPAVGGTLPGGGGRPTGQPTQSFWTSPLRTPVMIGVTAVGMALLLIVVGLFYLTMTNQQLVSTIAGRGSAPSRPSDMRSSPSGLMRGERWQLLPGGFGGFSTGASQEVY